jgi:hypothetical protein
MLVDPVFTQTGRAFDEAVSQGFLPEKQDGSPVQKIDHKIQAAYRYLFLLGYLDKKVPDTEVKSLRSMQRHTMIGDRVRVFQQEAMLAPSGELNEETWQALHQLASFECPIDVVHWMRGDQPLCALKRAAYLRLFAFGLSNVLPSNPQNNSNKQKQHEKKYQQALADFVKVANVLKLTSIAISHDNTAAIFQILFDQDAIGERLATGKAGINVYHPRDTSRRRRAENSKQATAFVQNIARIELWLFGYNISIGNVNADGRFVAKQGKLSLDAGLKQFFEDVHHKVMINKLERNKINGFFFAQILALRSEEPSKSDVTESVISASLSSKDITNKIKTNLRSIVSRIWDGAKRIWAWFKKFVSNTARKALKFVKQLATNLARFIQQKAWKIFDFVKNTIFVVQSSMQFMFAPALAGSSLDAIYISHDKDFDFTVFVHELADQAKVDNMSDQLLIRSKILKVASKIIGLLMSFFATVIRLSSVTPWFAILLALTKTTAAIKTLKETSEESTLLIGQLEDLQSFEGQPA